MFNPDEAGLRFECTSATFANCDSGTSSVPPPPLDISIDYGDDSGVARWNEDAPADVFRHVYSAPGTYHISVQSRFSRFSGRTDREMN